MIKEIELQFDDLTKSMQNLKNAINEVVKQENKMITEIKVGDYIEKSELDTEQKYNDVVEVFGQWGLTGYITVNDYLQTMNDEFQLIFVKDNRFMLCSHAAEIQRKLTYDQIVQLKKVDVDNCNVDKLVGGAEVDVSNGPFKSADTTEKIIFDDHLKPKSNRVSTVNRDLEGQMASRAANNKYERMIEDRYGDSCHVDVYDVLKAFEVTCPAIQHAIKKLLCTGLRGHKDRDTDLLEAKESIVRAVELNGEVK